MLLARQVLRRIRDEIEARRAAGERLPAPPKTAIAGPEYFGFNQPEVRLEGGCSYCQAFTGLTNVWVTYESLARWHAALC